VLHGGLALLYGDAELVEIGELPGEHVRGGADVAFNEPCA
jgi:hypothetical protein